jgi:hypothetical protein
MAIWMTLILVGAGLFSIAGGIFNWDWFMSHRRAALFVRLFGRMGARIFYILLGILIAAIGVAGSFGWID